jgi:hypothetical protein
VPVEDTAFLMDALVVARRRRSKCPGTRARASRGRAVRRRGSRRTASTRAGPEPGDPEPAWPGAPVGDTSRIDALAGRLA